jgi:hypothetical protein
MPNTPPLPQDVGALAGGAVLRAYFDAVGVGSASVPCTSRVLWTLDPRLATTVSAGSANEARGSRVISKYSGVITQLSYFVGTASGNIDLGIYSVSGQNRTKLYSSGSTASAGTNAWQSVTPNLYVNAGDILDFVIAVDNGTVTIAKSGAVTSLIVALPTDVDAAGSTLSWTKAASFPLPGSFATVNSGFTAIPAIIVATFA